MARVEPGGERAILAGGSRIVAATYRLPSAGDAMLLVRGRNSSVRGSGRELTPDTYPAQAILPTNLSSSPDLRGDLDRPRP